MRVVRDFSTRTTSKSEGNMSPSDEDASVPTVGEGLASPERSRIETSKWT